MKQLRTYLVGVIFLSIVAGTIACGGSGSSNNDNPVIIPPTPPCVIYVDDTATGTGNGSSWANAYNAVQDAVDAAISGCQVWVAEGTYFTDPFGSATDSVLIMKDDVNIYGGFAGTEASLSDRVDPLGLATILDGGSTSYHVVVGASDAVLDGFYVINGKANSGSPNERGGGMYNHIKTELTVNNCIFYGNMTIGAGGGMYINGGSLTISNCSFIGNSTSIYGGGIYSQSSSLTITKTTFEGNAATLSGSVGGGLWDGFSTLTVTECTFSGNSAVAYGGGMSLGINSATITNNTFIGNSANNGGGMLNDNTSPTITNCTFSGNSAVSNGGGMYNATSTPTITDSIMWGDTAVSGVEIFNDASTPNVTYSDIQGGYAGTGNISSDPLFEAGPFGNYYLQRGSPCVDTGSGLSSDYGLQNRTTNILGLPDFGTVDMGYHYPRP